MRKLALVTGVAGQDGSWLAELLLSKEYQVVGLIRRNAIRSLGNVAHLENDIDIEEGDITGSHERPFDPGMAPDDRAPAFHVEGNA